jgi:fumarate hydratase subunit beta
LKTLSKNKKIFIELFYPVKGEHMNVKLKTPISSEDTSNLRIGDIVYLSGTIFTARDSAHKRIIEEGAPVDIEGAVIFHAGPIIKKTDEGYDMVAVGPTTSTRMNPYEPEVINMGAGLIVGKGGMDEETAKALKKNKKAYLSAVGGCAALYVKSILKVNDVNWLDLGVPEAIWELEVKDFGPLIVTMDSQGGNLYDEVKKQANMQ